LTRRDLFLFLIGRRLYGHKAGLLAAALLSLSVLNIQLSHFYTVDTFANFFVVATIYFVLRASTSGRWIYYALAGLMLGLGMASKISVLTLAAPILAGAGYDYYRRSRDTKVSIAWEQTVVRLLTVFILAALTFRLVQPIAFSGPSFWNWSLNPRWLSDIIEQQKTVGGTMDLPWVQQWTGRSILFSFYNIMIWGMGLPLGLASLAGFGLATYQLTRYRKLEHLLPVTYVAFTFIYHAATFVKFMRYFLPIYPFLALFAAYLIAWLWRNIRASKNSLAEIHKPESPMARLKQAFSQIHLSPQLVFGVAAIVVGGTFLYAAAFSTIYSYTNSRITATRWIYQNIPPGSTLANEHWDDWLPIGGVDGKTAYGDSGVYQSVEMANYDDDTPEKLDKMVDNLSKADYLVLSSNRLYASIPRLPMRYPLTSRYYQLLFSGDLGFERIAEFTSYPRLFGLKIPDQSAEESFSVYDHPRVQIFKKTPAFNPVEARQKLGQGIDWEAVIHLTPRQASEAPKALRLSPDDRALYTQAAEGSSAEVNENSWGSRMPALAWGLILQWIALLALPITLAVFRNFVDRGYILSKVIGLLIVAWGAWMIASLRLAPFTWWMILLVMILLTIVSIPLAKRQWNELRSFMQKHWRLVLFEEVLFWGFFALSLFIRWSNPDLWHPWMGGEKPMDLAYLTAIMRTPYFPPYDPWFTGGYINYYYFGLVLVATLVHLTGVVPTTAYNLAVPTFFAMTAMGGFTVALNFAEGWRGRSPKAGKRWLGIGRATLLAGLCGALFVAVIGNLGQIRLLWDGVRNLSSIQADNNISPLLMLAQFADGLNQLLGGHPLQLRAEWWYWNATRLIPASQGEAGPINEMPFFTFLFGDLHAHMMALPYTLLALGLALTFVRDSVGEIASEGLRALWNDSTEVLTLSLLALTVGALWPMNTWDFPTSTALVAAALACREYARRRRIDLPGLWAVLWRITLVVIAGRLLFLPFHQNYASAYFGAELWKGSRTPLWAYLLIHGFFLFVLVSYLLVELFKGRGHNSLVRLLQLIWRYWPARKRIFRLIDLLTQPTPGYILALYFSGGIFLLVIVVLLIQPVIGLALGLGMLTALLLFSPRPNPLRQFLLCLIGLGFLLTALVEVIVLKGDISRMNTVFKFYLQVWILWAVASAAVLPELAARFAPQARPYQELRPILELPEGSAWTPEVAAQAERRRPRPVRNRARRWWWGFGLLLAACLLYPLTATPVRIRDRFQDSLSKTLDGSAYMRTAVYQDDGRPVTLDWERQAFNWLRQNVHGLPTILEANTPLYRWGSRVSIYTGVPTVIGWDWHEKQQRSVIPGSVIDQRIQDVKTIYTSTDLDQAIQLLDRYHVRYIYVGPLERIYYAGDGLNKFDQPNNNWRLVYQNEQVKIYQVY
jgi:YYY domain-containing protein